MVAGLNDHPAYGSISQLQVREAWQAVETEVEESRRRGSVSVVDERIKVPLLADALRIVARFTAAMCASRVTVELAELAGHCVREDVDLVRDNVRRVALPT